MIIYIDIDDTICKLPTDSQDYSEATPIYDRIAKMNDLYNQGHTIIYWTARGTKSGIDWRAVTIEQFNRWLVKYSQMLFGKPVYDIFIDDKNINSNEYFK
mgnify:CR=1 FL=1|jgi:hypothetical protein|tara:strand:+ start:7333 stop:7632 length:300 start_codon:yes stop_codon:yes gene_type:complete